MWKFQTIVIRNHTPCIVNRKTFLTRLNHEIEGVYLYFFSVFLSLHYSTHGHTHASLSMMFGILIAILSYWCRMFIVLKWAFSFLMKQVDAVYERVVDCAFIYFSFFLNNILANKIRLKTHHIHIYVHAYIYLYTHYTLYMANIALWKWKFKNLVNFFFSLFSFFRFVSVALCLFSHFLLFFLLFCSFYISLSALRYHRII